MLMLLCLVLKHNHDRILIMTLMMLGFPIESGVYNLIMLIIPVSYWCMCEPKDPLLPILGALLMACKSIFLVSKEPYVTWQAIINPVCILLMIGYIVLIRRKEIVAGVKCGWLSAEKYFNTIKQKVLFKREDIRIS